MDGIKIKVPENWVVIEGMQDYKDQAYILCKHTTEVGKYVTWGVNVYDGGCYGGHYFESWSTNGKESLLSAVTDYYDRVKYCKGAVRRFSGNILPSAPTE